MLLSLSASLEELCEEGWAPQAVERSGLRIQRHEVQGVHRLQTPYTQLTEKRRHSIFSICHLASKK